MLKPNPCPFMTSPLQCTGSPQLSDEMRNISCKTILLCNPTLLQPISNNSLKSNWSYFIFTSSSSSSKLWSRCNLGLQPLLICFWQLLRSHFLSCLQCLSCCNCVLCVLDFHCQPLKRVAKSLWVGPEGNFGQFQLEGGAGSQFPRIGNAVWETYIEFSFCSDPMKK